MLGWMLFLRAVRLILDNLDTALRVSLLPYAILAGAQIWIGLSYPDWIGVSATDPENLPPGGFVTGTVAIMLLNIFVTLWVAVAWHRYVLLSEAPNGWAPKIRTGEMLGYLGRSILIALLIALAVVAVTIPIGIVLASLGTAPGGVMGALLSAVGLFVGMILFYRLGVILPAGAINKPLTMGEAMRATEGQNSTVVVLALLTVGFSFLLQVPTLIEGSRGLITVLYQVLIGWIGLLLATGTLTAIYGHLVEGRPVD